MDKICVKCQRLRKHEAFGMCKPCYYVGYGKRYAEKNKKKLLEKKRKYYIENKERLKQKATEYQRIHKDKTNKKNKAWRQKNPDKAKQYQKKYREHNRVAINYRYINEFLKKPKNKISHIIRTGMNNSLKSNKNGYHWEDLAGYTIDDLMKRLESLFQEGMTFGNHGKWHIDHIKPVSSFNFKSYKDEEFKECWALENLRPLWARDNLRKNKY